LGDSLIIVVGLLDRSALCTVGTTIARIVGVTLALDQLSIDDLGYNSASPGTKAAN
jgi:hypothetical protein